MTGLLLAVVIINQADQAVFGIIAQPLKSELGLTSTQIGLVGSAFYAALSIGGLMAGVIHRWMSLRWALVVLALLWSLTALPLVISASIATLLIFRVLLGLTEGPSVPLVFTALYSWHPAQRRGLAGSLLQASSAATKFVIIPALAWVSVTFGWRASLLCIAVAAALWSAVWLTTWAEGPFNGRPRSTGSKTDSAEAGDGASVPADPKVPWRKIVGNRTFIFSALLATASFAVAATVLTWIPSYFEVGLGYSRLTAGAIFGLPSLVGLGVSLLTSTYSDRLLRRGVSTRYARIVLPAVALFISGAVLATIPAIDTPVLAVIAVTVGFALSMPCLPLVQAAMATLCPPQQIAGTMGALVAVFTIGGLISPFVTGVVVDAAATPAEGYATSFQVFGIAAIVAAVLAVLTVDPDRDAPHTATGDPQ